MVIGLLNLLLPCVRRTDGVACMSGCISGLRVITRMVFIPRRSRLMFRLKWLMSRRLMPVGSLNRSLSRCDRVLDDMILIIGSGCRRITFRVVWVFVTCMNFTLICIVRL